MGRRMSVTEACDRLGVICKPSQLSSYEDVSITLEEWIELFIILGLLEDKDGKSTNC